MQKNILLFVLIIFSFSLHSQIDTTNNVYMNTAEQLINSNGRLSIGGYGEVHYNQPITKGLKENGILDVHRIVMFLGYNFNSKTQFVSEIEFEYAKELWVEQAFIQHKLNKFMNLRAGLLLVPMGIINEYHEPTTFNGVERPIIDNKLAPSTWREVGAGFSGTILPLSIKYQLYLFGGLNGYDTKGIFSGSKGIREGRQKGSKAYVNSPAYAGKIEYFGITNVNIGLSGYFGKSQSRLFNKLSNDSLEQKMQADSSRVGISMIGLDARYNKKGFELRGQFYYTHFNNTLEYNNFTSTSASKNDLGKAMMGFYAETGYNILHKVTQTNYELIPFFRYEWYNLHFSVDENTQINRSYENTILTTGLTFKPHKNVSIKSDLQLIKPKNISEWNKTFNLGIGVMF